MAKNPRIRGSIQLIVDVLVAILLWFYVPSWEKVVLDVISKNPGPFLSGVMFLISFILKNWEVIAFIILVEALYAIFTNRNLIIDIVEKIPDLVKKIESWLKRRGIL